MTEALISSARHLSKKEQVRLGSYYTPERLVVKVHEWIGPYLQSNRDGAVILDNAAGYGAFLITLNVGNYRAADCDQQAVEILRQNLEPEKVFHANALMGVARERYNISDKASLIQIGNPPYNDTTSEFRQGQKGHHLCDPDIADRDLGISFLKAYNKLKADVACVLHPLSYLIKESNFKRLKAFRKNYRLIRAVVFPSSLFPGTGSLGFPIIIALYERNEKGMDFDYIFNFKFKVLDDHSVFALAQYETTDGYIRKYPPRKGEIQISPIGLYYYSFRDINSLRKNASFMNKPHWNAIVVTKEEFYKYAYLKTFKDLFQTDNDWLYGNLSPLLNRESLERSKARYVAYALLTSPAVRFLESEQLEEICDYYKVNLQNYMDVGKLTEHLRHELSIDNFLKQANGDVSNRRKQQKQMSLLANV